MDFYNCSRNFLSRVEIPLKNRSRFERFERFSSKIWAVWAVWAVFFGKTAQTAQILLKKLFKNRSFLAVILERFFKQDLSGFWAVFPGRGPRLNVSLESPPPPPPTFPPTPPPPPHPPTHDVSPSRLTIPPRNPQPRRVPPLSLVRGHLTLVRDINSSKRWGGTSTLVRGGGGGGLVCDLIIDYFCYFVETDNKNPDSIFVVHV